jgi:hypothetical protein
LLDAARLTELFKHSQPRSIGIKNLKKLFDALSQQFRLLTIQIINNTANRATKTDSSIGSPSATPSNFHFSIAFSIALIIAQKKEGSVTLLNSQLHNLGNRESKF